MNIKNLGDFDYIGTHFTYQNMPDNDSITYGGFKKQRKEKLYFLQK